METEKLSKIVYALTLRDRKDKQSFWYEKGFRRMHEMGINLLDYWQKKIQSNPDHYEKLAEEVFKKYEFLENNPELKNIPKPPKNYDK
jgi:hypothetical protein